MPITVTGHGTARGPADEAVVDLLVQVRRGSAAEALDALAGAVRVVFEVLEGGPAIERATADLGLGTDHDREGRPRGHQANQSVTTVVPIGEVGRVLGDVVTAAGDAVTVRSLSQRAADRDGLARQARADAVARARAAAEEHAALAGRALGDMVDLVEGTPGSPPRPAMRAMAIAEAMPVAVGTDAVAVTVTATWDLA